MDEYDPSPPPGTEGSARESWGEGTSVRERVEQVLLGLREPTPVAEVADLADCSVSGARKHLNALADLGVARVERDGQDRFRRNDEYLRWRRADELAREHGPGALLDRIESLEEREAVLAASFDATSPAEVGFADAATHDEAEDRHRRAGEWATVREELAVTRDALAMARRATERDRSPARG